MPLTAEQREARRQGIGGSDAAAVVGRHPYVSPLALWLDKVHGREVVENERMEAGNRLEPVIREWAADLLGQSVSVPPATIYHPLTKRMLVNLDGLLSDGRVLECKSIDGLQWRAMGDEDLVDGCARAHWWQVQHAMEVSDAPGAVVAYLVNGHTMELRPVERDRAIGKALREHIVRWWTRHVEGNEPPTQGTADDRMSLLERLHARESAGMLATTDPDLVALARQYEAASKAIEAANAHRDGIKADLCTVIGAAEGLDFGKAVGKVTWKANKHGSRTLRVSLRDAQEQDQ